MNLQTNTSPNTSNQYYDYCSSYATYTVQEIIDWATLMGFPRDEENDKGTRYLYVRTDIQCDENKENFLTFKFIQSHTNTEMRLYKALKGLFWMEEKNRSSGWYCSKYDWSNGVTFVKNIGFDLNGLYELYKKRFEKTSQNYSKKQKEIQQQQKLNDISLDDFEGELLFLAEKYGYTYESEYSSSDPTKKNFRFFKDKVGSIHFTVYTVKKYNLQCWQVWFSCCLIKETYSAYVKDLESIKKLAEGYMTMFNEKLMTGNYSDFIVK